MYLLFFFRKTCQHCPLFENINHFYLFNWSVSKCVSRIHTHTNAQIYAHTKAHLSLTAHLWSATPLLERTASLFGCVWTVCVSVWLCVDGERPLCVKRWLCCFGSTFHTQCEGNGVHFLKRVCVSFGFRCSPVSDGITKSTKHYCTVRSEQTMLL